MKTIQRAIFVPLHPGDTVIEKLSTTNAATHPLIVKANDIVERRDGEAALAMLKEMVDEMTGNDPDNETIGDDPGSESDGAEGVAPPKKTAAFLAAVKEGARRLEWKPPRSGRGLR
jgi:hypothetical protein